LTKSEEGKKKLDEIKVKEVDERYKYLVTHMSSMLLNEHIFKIMDLFARDYCASIHGREVSRKTRITQKSVVNVLARLKQKHILRSSTEGRNKYYALNLDNPSIEHLLCEFEEEKAARFIQRSNLPREYFDVFHRTQSPLVVVFGSYAKEKQDEGSDLDLLVVSPWDADVTGLIKVYGIRPSVKEYSLRDIQAAVRNGDYLINEIIKDHVILNGSNLYVRILMEARHGRH